MDNFKNAAPRMVFEGLADTTRRARPVAELQIPTHLPLSLVRSAWGLEVDQLVSGLQWTDLYGADVFSERSKYFTHGNLFADRINRAANKQLALRIVSGDAPLPSGMRHCVEYVIEDIQQYERAEDESYKLGADGKPIAIEGSTKRGVRIRHFFEPIQDPESKAPAELGAHGNERIGTMVSNSDGGEGGVGATGVILPLQEFRRPCRGKAGDLGGIRLSAPNLLSAGGARDDLMESERGYLYRLQMVERPDERSSPAIQPTLNGVNSILFSYKDDFFDKKTELEYGIDQVLKQSYNEEGRNGNPDTIGVFSDYHVYKDNLETFLKLIQSTELASGTVGSDAERDLHMVNFLTGISWLGIPYYTVAVDGPSKDGILFTENTVHYAQGGGDGDLSDEAFDKAVGEFFDSFETNDLRLWDPYRVPVSVIYDSGFSLDTKFKMLRVLGIRDDLWLSMQTQVHGEKLNTEDEDYSIGTAIKNRALTIPESVVNGTETVRCQIISGAGTRLDSKLRVPISLNLKVAEDFSRYMGAANQMWEGSAAPDEPENNGVDDYVKTNMRSKNDRVVDNFWESGIVYAQYRQRGELFIPAYQTVYPDDTSVLNSTFNMIIAVDVIKECRYVWTQLTGRTKLTHGQLVQECNRLVRTRLNNKYDSRIRVAVNAYLTPVDQTLGYAWHADVRLFMNNMITVGQFSVIAHRMDDLVEFEQAA